MYNDNQIQALQETLEIARKIANNRNTTIENVLAVMKVIELSGINENLGEIKSAVLELVPDPDNPIVKKLGEISTMLDAVANKIEEK